MALVVRLEECSDGGAMERGAACLADFGPACVGPAGVQRVAGHAAEHALRLWYGLVEAVDDASQRELVGRDREREATEWSTCARDEAFLGERVQGLGEVVPRCTDGIGDFV